tara:strand:- start:46 stop:429 length:384 start_codon:yes stop_codon:yes gene_type:complete
MKKDKDKKNLNVPSHKELKKLMKNARKNSSKAVRKTETLEENYIRITEENIYQIFSNSSIKHPFLMLKCLAISATKKLEKMHNETAKSHYDSKEYDYVVNWAIDEGKLNVAENILRSIQITKHDWMI